MFEPSVAPSFVWGTLNGHNCVSIIDKCYSVAVLWRPNLFKILNGKVGESFVKELSRLFNAYATASALESVAMKAAFLLSLLILQRPSRRMKPKEVTAHIERQLLLG